MVETKAERLSAIVAVGLLLVLATGTAVANVQYNFASVPFNNYYNINCPPACNLTGWFIAAQALPPNMSGPIGGSGSYFPLSFSFTDGYLTVTNTNTPTWGFDFDTDSSGNITAWNFYTSGGPSQIFSYYDSPNLTQEGSNAPNYGAYFFGNSSGGTWYQTSVSGNVWLGGTGVWSNGNQWSFSSPPTSADVAAIN